MAVKKGETTVDQYEKQIYDLKQLLEISKSLCSVVDINKLSESILYSCMCQMRVLGATMFVLPSFDSDSFKLDTNYSDIVSKNDIKYELSINHPIIDVFAKNKATTYTLDELKKAAGDKEVPIQISSLNPSLIVPLKQQNHINGIILLGERIDLGDGVEYSDYDRQQIATIATLAYIALNNATLVEMTTTDMMTKLKLKHYFYKVLQEKLDFSVANHLPLAVMMLDIDFFKKFNDTYGHACGDYVLQNVAATIQAGIRSQDMAGRYGGEEFVVMLFGTEKTSSQAVAERIRSDIEHNELEYEDNKMKVTISIGVSVFDPDQKEVTAKQLVEMADQALYISKRNGRNRITVADDEIIHAVLNNETEN
jgi:diguanylate cyclase (GGDEF)-like protein